MERIKTIRQKNGSGNYESPMPLGTDGNLVDMFSELNLEHELKLGSKHIASIKTVSRPQEADITIITEDYATPIESVTPGAEFYRVITTITPTSEDIGEGSKITDIINAELYWIKIGQDSPTDDILTFIKGKETQIIETTVAEDKTYFTINEIYHDTPSN